MPIPNTHSHVNHCNRIPFQQCIVDEQTSQRPVGVLKLYVPCQTTCFLSLVLQTRGAYVRGVLVLLLTIRRYFATVVNASHKNELKSQVGQTFLNSVTFNIVMVVFNKTPSICGFSVKTKLRSVIFFSESKHGFHVRSFQTLTFK